MSDINGTLPRDSQYIEKCNEYMDYINYHRDRVMTAYKKYFEGKLSDILEENKLSDAVLLKEELYNQIMKHDMSKYSDEEFEPYRAFRYPTDAEKEAMANDEFLAKLIEEKFIDAMDHHRKVNPHHPYYYLWINDDGSSITEKPRESALDMPIAAIIEMICDWASFDDDFDYLKWYVTEDAKDVRIIMSYNTKVIVENITSKILPDKWIEYKTKYPEIFVTSNE